MLEYRDLYWIFLLSSIISYIHFNCFFICPTFVCAFDAVIGEWLQKLAIAGDGVLEENGKN